ncbi:MAG: hypothetical protein JW993_15080 [Sedimentisphaerales bacterium]|nr:hypothetical protein [Sedimentisphaerales bacterium]
MDITTLGLKQSYAFKETHIPSVLDGENIRACLRDKVAPAIRKLEAEGLINGFHHIIHEKMDLRLSSGNWSQHEQRIQGVLSAHSIPTELKDWQLLPIECYGGETGVSLCYNNLEFNRRLCMALVEASSETSDKAVRDKLMRLCPHRWVHYLCNQSGHLNMEQIVFELEDAFGWLCDFTSRNRHDPQASKIVSQVISQVETKIAAFRKCLANVTGE